MIKSKDKTIGEPILVFLFILDVAIRSQKDYIIISAT